MFKYTLLALLLAGSFMPSKEIDLVIACLVGFMATGFYWMCFNLLAGLNRSYLNLDIKVHDLLILISVHTTATIYLYYHGFETVALLAVPWLAMNIVSDTLNILIQTGVLAISTKSKEEE